MWTVKLSEKADEEYQFWVNHNPVILKKINKLIDDIAEHPKMGIGKPEALKYELSGYWSRHITLEHRIVYCFDDDTVYIVSLMYHYKKQ